MCELNSKQDFLLSKHIHCLFFDIGKAHVENVYCKVFLGDQQQQTDVAKENIINGNSIQNGVPQVPTLTWNHSMQFHVRNLNEDILSLAVYEMCPFSPDGKFVFILNF